MTTPPFRPSANPSGFDGGSDVSQPGRVPSLMALLGVTEDELIEPDEPGRARSCPWAGPTDPIQPCTYDEGHDGPHSYMVAGRVHTFTKGGDSALVAPCEGERCRFCAYEAGRAPVSSGNAGVCGVLIEGTPCIVYAGHGGRHVPDTFDPDTCEDCGAHMAECYCPEMTTPARVLPDP